MSKKIIAMILAIIMVLGTMPVLATLSFADQSFGLYGDGYEGMAYDVQTLEMTDIILLFTYGCDDQTDMSDNPGNYTWVLSIDGVDYTAQPSSFYSDWLVRFKPIQWSTPYVPAWSSTVEFGLTVYSGDTAVLDTGTTVSITFPDQPACAGDIAATPVADGSSVTYAYDSLTNTLTFDGTGTIPSYSDVSTRPWHGIKDSIVKVVVKGGITAVGDRACNSFPNLDEIVLEEGVTSTGFDCFAHCGTITSVYLPTTLTSMSQGGFYGSSIVDVYYDDTSRDFGDRCTMGAYNDAITNANWVNDPEWGSFGDLSDAVQWAFDSSTGTLSITGTGVIPSPATKPWQSFVNQITKVVIGDGITEIPGGGLFAHLDNLDRVEMPETVTKIGGDAFAYNGTISYLKLSSNVTSISQGVLYASSVTTISCLKDWRAIQQQSSVGNYNDAFGNATWVDCVIFGTYFSFGKYGSGMENWQGNGDPRLTQILIATPKWDGVYEPAFNSMEWTLTIAPVDGSESAKTMTMYPRSIYNGGTWSILRFVPALCTDAANRFKPTNGKAYQITATITFNGVTETVTSADTFVLNDEPIEFETYYDITWQIEGVTEYVDNIPAGFKPVYHGAAASYEENGYAHIANIPETVAADANAIYNITYTVKDMTVGRLYLWGSGYENWNGQTQFLLRTADWEGNELTAINGHTAEYDWILTINGTTYNVKPSSNYAATIWRFEPVLWATPLIPQAGATYSVGLEIYDANQALVFQSEENTTITIADDFMTIHAHNFATSWVWEDDFSAAALTLVCPDCYGTVTLDATVVDNGDNSYTATAEYDGVTYTDTAYGNPAGDINGDMALDVTDVTALLDYLGNGTTAGILENMLDVDGNGEVNVSDVTALLDALANA